MTTKSLFFILAIFISSNIFGQKLVKMVEVEGGTFTMGNKTGSSDDEKTEHEVTLSSFYISQFEINFDEYSAFCKIAGYAEPSGQKSFPITNITWEKAVMFCNWLSGRDGLDHAYEIERNDKKKTFSAKCNFKASGYRLPTEAEWEFAAKGGTRSKGYIYSGSNSPYDVAWFSENYKGLEHKSGEKYPNELGIYDMTGNVAEWCWDNYDKDYYKKSEKTDPLGSKIEAEKVFRGGSRRDKIELIGLSRRNKLDRKSKDFYVGFRVVKTKI